MEFEVDKDGVKFRHRWYISEDFKATGIQQKLVESVNIKLKGYVLNLVVRYIWVEVRGRLIELEAIGRSRVDGDELYVPLSALESTAEMLAIVRSKTRNSAEAATITPVAGSNGDYAVTGTHTYAEETYADKKHGKEKGDDDEDHHDGHSSYTITVTIAEPADAGSAQSVTTSATVSDPNLLATGTQFAPLAEGSATLSG